MTAKWDGAARPQRRPGPRRAMEEYGLSADERFTPVPDALFSACRAMGLGTADIGVLVVLLSIQPCRSDPSFQCSRAALSRRTGLSSHGAHVALERLERKGVLTQVVQNGAPRVVSLEPLYRLMRAASLGGREELRRVAADLSRRGQVRVPVRTATCPRPVRRRTGTCPSPGALDAPDSENQKQTEHDIEIAHVVGGGVAARAGLTPAAPPPSTSPAPHEGHAVGTSTPQAADPPPAPSSEPHPAVPPASTAAPSSAPPHPRGRPGESFADTTRRLIDELVAAEPPAAPPPAPPPPAAPTAADLQVVSWSDLRDILEAACARTGVPPDERARLTELRRIHRAGTLTADEAVEVLRRWDVDSPTTPPVPPQDRVSETNPALTPSPAPSPRHDLAEWLTECAQ